MDCKCRPIGITATQLQRLAQGFSPGSACPRMRPEGGARRDKAGFVGATGHIDALIHQASVLGGHFQGDLLYGQPRAEAWSVICLRFAADSPTGRYATYGLVGLRPEKSSFVSVVMASGANGCCLKSKQLSMSFAARSRSVKAGRLKRVSISFRGEVKSNWV
jgi:hypothetical protein